MKQKKVKRVVIYTNEFDSELFEGERAYIAAEEGISLEDVKDDDVWEMYNSFLQMEFERCQEFLELMYKETYRIIMVGTVGTWRGSRFGGKILTDIREIVRVMNCDTVSIYVENRRLYIEGSHHDGSHSFEVRTERMGTTNETWEELENLLGRVDGERKIENNTKALGKLALETVKKV